MSSLSLFGVKYWRIFWPLCLKSDVVFHTKTFGWKCSRTGQNFALSWTMWIHNVTIITMINNKFGDVILLIMFVLTYHYFCICWYWIGNMLTDVIWCAWRWAWRRGGVVVFPEIEGLLFNISHTVSTRPPCSSPRDASI